MPKVTVLITNAMLKTKVTEIENKVPSTTGYSKNGLSYNNWRNWKRNTLYCWFSQKNNYDTNVTLIEKNRFYWHNNKDWKK